MEEVPSVLDLLVEDVVESPAIGQYDHVTHTWSHRDQAALSPQKHHQEM